MFLSRNEQLKAIARTLGDRAGLQLLHQDQPIPADISEWLWNLSLLVNVPFSYLVPDPAMLPPESIRFFQIDPEWITALLAGACSVGRASASDLRHDEALLAALHDAIEPEPIMSGFLLRSAVVTGWPGLEVSAFGHLPPAVVTTAVALPQLRMELLAPGLMLFIAAGVVTRVHLHEPAEGLHFGVTVDGQTKRLRYISPPSGAANDQGGPAQGDTIPEAHVSVSTRQCGRVVNMDVIAVSMQDTLQAKTFTSAELALQLVEGVQSVRFVAADPR